MGNSNELLETILTLAEKVDLAKVKRLQSLIPELKSLDELLGHNADTALEHLQAKSEPMLGDVPSSSKSAVMDLLMLASADAIQIASRMIIYNLPSPVSLLIHIDDLLDLTSEIPQFSPNTPEMVQKFLSSNPTAHLIIFSHDNADVTAVLVSALCGAGAIEKGQVSMVYESGMGLYIGGDTKHKQDLLSTERTELIHLLERMSVVAATKMGDKRFKENFFITATEYSIGIRVHPYSRANSDSLDKEAASELANILAVALSDLVKEDVSAVRSRVINQYLVADQTLARVFSKSNDERVWDMEKVDQLLDLFRFVHLGARGSIIRPADSSDVKAAEVIIQTSKNDSMVVVAGDSVQTKPLLDWALDKKLGFIACSDVADHPISDLVETRGGVIYAAGHISELFEVIGAYTRIKNILK